MTSLVLSAVQKTSVPAAYSLAAKCRLCRKQCQSTSDFRSNRKIVEKLMDIVCLWIDIDQIVDICLDCRQTVEKFHRFKELTRNVLRNEITKKSAVRLSSSNDLQSNMQDESTGSVSPQYEPEAFSCSAGEETYSAESSQEPEPENTIRYESPTPPKKTYYVRKTNREYRAPHKKTEEELAMTPAEYRKHFRKVYGSRYRTLCTICGTNVPNRFIEGHMNRHSGLEPFACEHCGERFHCKLNMHNHVVRNHIQDEEKECEVCGKICFNKRIYQQHVRTHQEKKFECTICGLKHSSRRSLETHLDMHNQKRDYQCDQCGKAFYRQSVLNIHLRTHSGETPYTCPCPKGFVHRIIYVKHMQKIHPGEPMMRMGISKTLKDAYRKKHFGK